MLDTRKYLIKTQSSSDMGLGGIVLEGASGIGKTVFLDRIGSEFKDVIVIPAHSTYLEKVTLLTKAFHEGKICIAQEFNTKLWPNKLLNNFMMGLDEHGKPKNTGFIFLTTQNPISIQGRMAEDPAIERRRIKVKVKWPVHPAVLKKIAERKANQAKFDAARMASCDKTATVIDPVHIGENTISLAELKGIPKDRLKELLAHQNFLLALKRKVFKVDEIKGLHYPTITWVATNPYAMQALEEKLLTLADIDPMGRATFDSVFNPEGLEILSKAKSVSKAATVTQFKEKDRLVSMKKSQSSPRLFRDAPPEVEEDFESQYLDTCTIL